MANTFSNTALLALTLAGALNAPAMAALSPSIPPVQPPIEAVADTAGRPCIGLVLGGGGARGAAHIGVLRVLERERVPICRIAGTSMGAIVGALYASGMRADEIEKILTSVDWRELFSDEPDRALLPMRRKDAQLNYRAELDVGWREGGAVLPYGAVQGQRLGLFLRRMLLPVSGIRRFDELPIPFRAVAADIVTGEAVVFRTGDLAYVVRASMAVPAVFSPIEINGRLLVDGGIVDNVPIGLVRRMGADVVIAVDVGSPLMQRDTLRNPLAVAYQMVSVLINKNAAESVATLGPDDLLLNPPLGSFSSGDFANAPSVIDAGVQAAEAALAKLRTMALPEAQWVAWQQAHSLRQREITTIEFVEVEESRTRTAALVRKRSAFLKGEAFDPDAVDAAVQSLYAEGTYQRIGWRLLERDGQTGIALDPYDKAWGPSYAGFGLQISDDFNGRSDYQLTVELLRTGLSSEGDELRLLGRLGRVTELSADWFAPFDTDRRFALGLDVGYRAQNEPITLAGLQSASDRLTRTTLGARFALQVDPRWSLEAGLRRSVYEGRQLVGSGPLDELQQQATAVGLRYAWDTLDSLSFPRRGARTVWTVDRYGPWLGGEGSGWVSRLRSDAAFSTSDHHLLVGGRWSTLSDQPPTLAGFSTLGGFLNLSGAVERSRAAPRLAYGRAVYYYRLGDSTALLSVPTYVGFSAELGQAWNVGQSFRFGEATRAGSVFVGVSSPFGPILFGYGRNSDAEDSWMLSFGNMIRNED